MSFSSSRLLRFLALAAALVLPLMLDSCSSSKKKTKGVPANLPVIPIHASSATPPHSMSHSEYPFDSGGSYVSAWAAEGERSAGRGEATSSDHAEWESYHHDGRSTSSSSREKKSSLSLPVKVSSGAVTKVTSSSPKKSSSSTSKTTTRKIAASPAKKTGSKGSYKVSKGDTLSGIARKKGTTVAKIKAANGLKSDIIRDGQSLRIP